MYCKKYNGNSQLSPKELKKYTSTDVLVCADTGTNEMMKRIERRNKDFILFETIVENEILSCQMKIN